MATITSRSAFKDYCLRRLGFPVIEINAGATGANITPPSTGLMVTGGGGGTKQH
jgi:hypothetical protein